MQLLHAYYDTRLAPVTFDYLSFLACADARRQSLNLPYIHLHIVAPAFRKKSPRDVAFDDAQKRWRVNHMLMRIPALVPTIMRLTLHNDVPDAIGLPTYPEIYPIRTKDELANEEVRMMTPYLLAYVTQYYKHGLNVQPFRATDYARAMIGNIVGDEPYYTISLRTSHFQLPRNSRLDEWYKVYKAITAKGHKVYVIPDFEDMTSDRLAAQYDWTLADFATYEHDLRLALCERAIDNLSVSNGPAVLLGLSKAPVKMFKMLVDKINTTSMDFIKSSTGVEVGGSPQFFQPNQKWIWLDDTAENILGTLSI